MACGSDPLSIISTCTNKDGDVQSDYAELSCLSDPLDATSLAPDSDGDGNPDCLRGYPSLPITGQPGATADCRNTLPCTWVSVDSSIIVKVTFADDFLSRHSVGFEMQVSDRDTTISLLNEGEAKNSNGEAYSANITYLNGVRSYDANIVNFVAATPVRGRQVFDHVFSEDAVGSELSQLTLPFIEAGTRFSASFSNIPYGRVFAIDRDCGDTLPCSWVSADGTSKVTLTAAGTTLAAKLFVDFSLENKGDPLNITYSVGSRASADDFSEFKGNSIRLGQENTTRRDVTVFVPQAETLEGGIVFADDLNAVVSSLTRLHMLFYDSSIYQPVQAPIFRNVPVTQ